MGDFWEGKRVLVTGHTGFKGAWLTVMLKRLGADVSGYALDPLDPSLFKLLYPNGFSGSIIANIRSPKNLEIAVEQYDPEIVFHMAAQPEVRIGYESPIETCNVNTLGTVNVLNALRDRASVKSIVVITTDKVYKDVSKYGDVGYGEAAEMGGADPYSCSKACADLAAQMYGEVFLKGIVSIARSGNVIGGGDWAKNRLVPNCIRAINGEHELVLYDPEATRPWQHVIDCLRGYMLLAERVCDNPDYATSWNFGPAKSASIKEVVDLLFKSFGVEPNYKTGYVKYAEAKHLHLNCSAAKFGLGWMPKFDLKRSVELTAEWHKSIGSGKSAHETCIIQIEESYA